MHYSKHLSPRLSRVFLNKHDQSTIKLPSRSTAISYQLSAFSYQWSASSCSTATLCRLYAPDGLTDYQTSNEFQPKDIDKSISTFLITDCKAFNTFWQDCQALQIDFLEMLFNPLDPPLCIMSLRGALRRSNLGDRVWKDL